MQRSFFDALAIHVGAIERIEMRPLAVRVNNA